MVSPESLVQKSCDRHGGIDKFASIGPIRIQLTKLSGIVPRLKGLGLTYSLPETIVVDPNALTATFEYEADVIAYDAGAIASNEVSKPHYRKTFDGFRKIRFWSREDACYFFGYALIGYFGLPFSLTATKLIGCGRSSNGLSWVEAEFAREADTHSRKQRFWFDDSGLLVRHDYRADIIGPIFWGAHFSDDYCFDNAVPLAKSRTVKLRVGRLACPIPVLHAKMNVLPVE